MMIISDFKASRLFIMWLHRLHKNQQYDMHLRRAKNIGCIIHFLWCFLDDIVCTSHVIWTTIRRITLISRNLVPLLLCRMHSTQMNFIDDYYQTEHRHTQAHSQKILKVKERKGKFEVFRKTNHTRCLAGVSLCTWIRMCLCMYPIWSVRLDVTSYIQKVWVCCVRVC